jgi:hypothetical protein
MAHCYLRVGGDTLDEAEACDSKASAIRRFQSIAEDLDRFGQEITGEIHYANSKAELQEYPDFALSLGPRGGVRVEPC